MTGDRDWGPHTTAVHGGAFEGPPSRALTTPVWRTSTFRFGSTDELVEASRGAAPGFYTRYGHPNFEVVERKFAALHGAEGAVLFASGMGALAALLSVLVRPGGRVVAFHDVYGGTRTLLDHLGRREGVRTSWVDTGDLTALEAALPGAAALVAESPTNPLLRVLDLAAVAGRARAAGVPFVLDDTFAGPILQRPLALGADWVFESATKSLGGHSDLLGGLVAGCGEGLARLREARRVLGAVPDPETAWLLERGMKTLALRVERQARTAEDLARRLERDPRVRRVLHPALPSHPDHAVARAQGTERSALVAFAVRGGAAAARALADRVRLVANAPSLGGVESLLCLPALTSHAGLDDAEREALGITPDLVRLSVGLEDADDLHRDLDRALGDRVAGDWAVGSP